MFIDSSRPVEPKLAELSSSSQLSKKKKNSCSLCGPNRVQQTLVCMEDQNIPHCPSHQICEKMQSQARQRISCGISVDPTRTIRSMQHNVSPSKAKENSIKQSMWQHSTKHCFSFQLQGETDAERFYYSWRPISS